MKDSLKKIFSRSFDQICFVVPDIEEAIEYWKHTNGIEAWNVAHDLALHQTEKEYYGKPGNFQFSCGYGYAGETLIELARHDRGDSVYNDWIQSGQKGPHHVGFRLTTPEDYAEAEQHYQQAGLVKAMAGYFSGPFGDCRWSYYDTRAQIGCFTELYYVTGEIADRMERLKHGEPVSITS